MIHDENEPILTLLPHLARGLLSRVNQLDAILQFIDVEIAKSFSNQVKVERLKHIKNQLLNVPAKSSSYFVDVDKQKTLVLGLTFGNIYTPALALLTGNHVSVQLWGQVDEISPLKIIEECIFGSSGIERIFVQVSKEPSIEPENTILEVNPILQLRDMLAKIGLTINLTSFDLEGLGNTSNYVSSKNFSDEKTSEYDTIDEPVKILCENVAPVNGKSYCEGHATREVVSQSPCFDDSSKVTVDLHNWLCTCAEFTDQSYVIHEFNGDDILSSSTASNTVSRLFENACCNFPKLLPLCKHILAVILLLMNWEVSLEADLLHAVWVKEENARVELTTS